MKRIYKWIWAKKRHINKMWEREKKIHIILTPVYCVSGSFFLVRSFNSVDIYSIQQDTKTDKITRILYYCHWQFMLCAKRKSESEAGSLKYMSSFRLIFYFIFVVRYEPHLCFACLILAFCWLFIFIREYIYNISVFRAFQFRIMIVCDRQGPVD